MLGRRAVLAGAGGLAARVAGADPAPSGRTVLRVSWADRLDTLDPYHSPLRTALMLAHELYDCLIDRDPETFAWRPLLAESWAQEDDRTLLFRLRDGITFHDGAPFEAEDVAATVRTVLSDPGLGIPSNYSWLAGARATGPREVRLLLAHPFPAALDYVAMVLPILPRAAASADGRAALATHPNGTGPYRLVGTEPDGTLRLAAFAPPSPSPKGPAVIAEVRIRQLPESGGPFQDLLAGRADWIWQLTPRQVRELSTRDDLQVARSESMRVSYLSFDAAGRSDGIFSDPHIRRAACHAIDREALARDTVPGDARTATAPCAPTQFACDASASVRYPHDPARARALLAGAGFPAGLDTELVTYVRPEIANAAAASLAEAGIRARVSILPAAAALARVAAGTAPLFLGSWGSSSINDISAFLPPFFAFGPLDMTRDGDVASLLAEAGLTVDPEARRELYRQAIRRITDLAFMLPLFVDPATYGLSRGLGFRPMPDELPRFYRAVWK